MCDFECGSVSMDFCWSQRKPKRFLKTTWFPWNNYPITLDQLPNHLEIESWIEMIGTSTIGSMGRSYIYCYIYHKNSNHSCRYISVILWVDSLPSWMVDFLLLYINVGKYTSLIDSSWHTDLGKTTSASAARGFSLSFWFAARWQWELASDTRLKLQYLLSMFLVQDFGSQMSLWLTMEV